MNNYHEIALKFENTIKRVLNPGVITLPESPYLASEIEAGGLFVAIECCLNELVAYQSFYKVEADIFIRSIQEIEGKSLEEIGYDKADDIYDGFKALVEE